MQSRNIANAIKEYSPRKREAIQKKEFTKKGHPARIFFTTYNSDTLIFRLFRLLNTQELFGGIKARIYLYCIPRKPMMSSGRLVSQNIASARNGIFLK